jgi:hypothetical protein
VSAEGVERRAMLSEAEFGAREPEALIEQLARATVFAAGA